MHFVDRHREKIRQSPMSSRLLWACLLLVVLLVLTFGAALFLFASLHNTKKDISRSLQIQFSVFQNDMERYFDQLAVMGVNLSEDMSAEVDKELALRQMSFAQLNDSPEVLNALEEEMIEPLCRRLRQTGCSGAFVLLDATVNTRMEGAEHSRAGLYVQKSGADSAYAGISQLCRLSESQSYRLAVCIPMADYRRLVFSGNLQMLLIGLFIAFFVVFCCMNFHRRILSPAFRQFEEDRRESRRRMDELQLERQQMQTELSRLADVCRNESVPDAFQTFVAGIPTLTKTERRIFDGYAAGLRTREIAQQLDIKDSTLRFHNKNIYDKLGVSSLKQLQQFVAILNSGSGSAPDENAPPKGR